MEAVAAEMQAMAGSEEQLMGGLDAAGWAMASGMDVEFGKDRRIGTDEMRPDTLEGEIEDGETPGTRSTRTVNLKREFDALDRSSARQQPWIVGYHGARLLTYFTS